MTSSSSFQSSKTLYLLNLYRSNQAYDVCLDFSSLLLSDNPYDQLVWMIKARSIADLDHPGPLDYDFDNINLLDSSSTLTYEAKMNMPRPATSLHRPASASLSSSNTKNSSRSHDPAAPAGAFGNFTITDPSNPSKVIHIGHHHSNANATSTTNNNQPPPRTARITTGYLRPTTAARETAIKRGGATSNFTRNLLQTSSGRAMSSSGRLIRLGTASLASEQNGPFIVVEKLDLKKYAAKPLLAKALFDYIYNHLQDIRKALELASLATEACEYKDWWWKLQIGKCYLRLQMYHEAEKQLKSSLKNQDMLITRMYLAKVLIDQGHLQQAVDLYEETAIKYQEASAPLIGLARLKEIFNEVTQSTVLYKQVLQMDGANAEAMACLASTYFYNFQPEIAHRYYLRVVQMGYDTSPEVWSNLGLSAFYSNQYDSCVPNLERALELAEDDDIRSNIWYNIGIVMTNLADYVMAYRAFKVAVSLTPDFAEAWNNLGIIERKLLSMHSDEPGISMSSVTSHFQTSMDASQSLHEPCFNLSVIHKEQGDISTSYRYVNESLKRSPSHGASLALRNSLSEVIMTLF